MNIKKIIREEIDDESNEFKWIEDTQLDSLYVGALMLIDENSLKGSDSYLGKSPGDFILLKITVISDEDNKIYYMTEDSNMQDEEINSIGHTDLDWAKELIEEGYWQPLFPGNDAHKAYYDTHLFHKRTWLKEGKDEFDWIDDIEGTIKHADNIQYALRKPFGITYPDDDTTTGPYWIEHSDFIGRSSPDYWKVCWERGNPDAIYLNNMGTTPSSTIIYDKKTNDTVCTDYYSSDIVDKFKLGYWKFL